MKFNQVSYFNHILEKRSDLNTVEAIKLLKTSHQEVISGKMNPHLLRLVLGIALTVVPLPWERRAGKPGGWWKWEWLAGESCEQYFPNVTGVIQLKLKYCNENKAVKWQPELCKQQLE